MSKGLAATILAGFGLLSLVIGWTIGKGVHDVGIALFFYLLAMCFFLAIFRPQSL
jgi:hypothetical protein